jgi:hypothetical protein
MHCALHLPRTPDPKRGAISPLLGLNIFAAKNTKTTPSGSLRLALGICFAYDGNDLH